MKSVKAFFAAALCAGILFAPVAQANCGKDAKGKAAASCCATKKSADKANCDTKDAKAEVKSAKAETKEVKSETKTAEKKTASDKQ